MIIAPEWPPKARLKRREAIPFLGLDDLDLEYQKRSTDSVSGYSRLHRIGSGEGWKWIHPK